MTQPEQATHLSMNNQLVRLVSGKSFANFVKATFPNKIWKFPFQASPVFVPSAILEPCRICEYAVETWLAGINGKHYDVSVSALVRYFSARGLIPEGNYLLLTNPESYGERLTSCLSDESTIDGPKGVF